MDVQTITMDPSLAYGKLIQYQEAVKRSQSLSDRILVKTYKQLSEGHSLINVRDVIAEGGVDELHRPNFAIARADQRFVWYSKRASVPRGDSVIRFSTYDTRAPCQI